MGGQNQRLQSVQLRVRGLHQSGEVTRTRMWIEKRELLQSARERHAKVKSLLDDPVIAAKLQTYLHSNKWAMNPGKLAQFSKNELISSAADKYLCQVICDEMPWG